jgi:hypothetical protein
MMVHRHEQPEGQPFVTIRRCLFGSISPEQHERRSFGRLLAISCHRSVGKLGRRRREPSGLMVGKGPARNSLCGIKPNWIVSDDGKRE